MFKKSHLTWYSFPIHYLGIREFLIIDKECVQPCDLGCNFFVTEDRLQKSRAITCSSLLGELNDNVIGDYIDEVIL
jgi:hypothetical protein